ncbi:MAG: TonB-dependent receptor [Bacteroidales bacterium]|nr:TonB-dependent receptor [Bacteroidales bacterium]
MNHFVRKTLQLLLAAALLCCVQSAFAQKASVTGTVVDALGPVVGATVIVEGSDVGAQTDLDGKFILNAKEGTAIVVSCMGYRDVRTVLSDGMLVKLEEDTTVLEEVVVVGYGVQKKETLSGAISVVKDEQLQNKGSLSSPLQALQGQVPGVIITRSSSAPGDESWSMSLRGASSRNSAEPLVIIDGVAYESINEMRLLNPSDIQSMSFLKDGSAAIYGSRAAGGVVLITTKSGAKGKAKVEYTGSVTMKTVGLMPELMTLDEWSSAVMSALENDGTTDHVWYKYAQLAKQYKGMYIDLLQTANPYGTTAFTDVSDFVFDDKVNWLNDLFGTSFSTSHNLSVSGGSDRMSYRVSAGYLYDGSPLKFGNNNNQRYNIRLNNTAKITDWLTLESMISYNRQEQVAPTNIGAVLTINTPMPGLPMFTSDGKPYGWGTWASPAARAEYGGDNHLSVSAINISETIKANITKWLDFNLNLGYNTSTAARSKVNRSVDYYNYAGTKKVLTTPTAADTYYNQTASRTDFYSVTGFLNGHHKFNNAHNLSVTLGGQYEFRDYSIFGVEAKDIQDCLEVVNGSGETKLSSVSKSQWAIASVFARANYDYRERYLVELNARYDGSSKFQPENRWKFFWGGSVAWRIGKEEWLKDASWLDELKLRLSYGQVGNQAGIDNYDGVLLYNANSNNGALVGNGLLSTITTSGKLISLTRQWETIQTSNVGIDFGFLGNRLTGTVEAFLKQNNNMLVNIDYPSVIGDTAPTTNSGKFKAWGYEGQIQWRDHYGDFSYNIGGTFTFARNRLVDLGGSANITAGKYVSNREGYPINSLFGLRYGGKIQTQEQLDAYVGKYYEGNGIGMPSELRLGDNMFVDENKDGKLDENDYIFLGSDTPEIQYSFNLGLAWKGLDFSLVFQGAANRTVFNGVNNWTVPMRALYTNTTNQSVGNVWSPSNPDGHYPSYTTKSNINTYNYQCSTWSASNGAYIRLKNVSLGYSLPSVLFENRKGVSGCRFYFTGADLWEYSQIQDGWDPEAKSNPSTTSRYPFLRTFTFGVNLSF